MHWNGDWHMGSMGLWWFVIIAALAVVVWFVFSAARRRGDGAEASPEEVLKRRYAKGEMDRATYQRTLEGLRN